MSRLAKTFGLSDVGLRKICVKHAIPTPPLGYWAKRAHGKRVHQKPLPSSAENPPIKIHLVARPILEKAAALVAAEEAALANEADQPLIVVPIERPAKLHPIAAATARAVRSTRADSEGIKHAKGPGGDTSIAAASLDRALCIIDAFARAAEDRGYAIEQHEEGARIIIDGIPLAWCIYEIKDRAPHQPTKEEIKVQAQREADRARWPSLYSSGSATKVYRSWDYFPSGRLAMNFIDTTCFRWASTRRIGHWRDRKNKRLEDYLGDAMVALATGAIAVKHRLAEEAEAARLRAEEDERRRVEQARRERALKRHEFILKKAEDFGRYERLAAFAAHLESEVYEHTDEPVDRLIDELTSVVAVLAEGFEREALIGEIGQLNLYAADDLPTEPSDEDD